MTADSTDLRAALRHAVDVLRWCLLGRHRKGVLGYASSESGRSCLARYAFRWKSLPRAVAALWRPRPGTESVADEWVLAREGGGWAVRREQGPPAYFTADIPADDQNAAFDWAREITPDADEKAIHYVGPLPR